MDFDRLFGLYEAGEPGAFFAMPAHQHFNAPEIAQGTQDPPSPCRFRHNCGSKLFDMMGSGFASLLLMSARAIQILRDGGFTGWRSFPVEIEGKKGQRVEGYEGLVITGRCGPVNWSRGKHVRKPPPVPRGQGYDAWVGMYFDPASWDGFDVFLPEGTTYITVTETVKLAFERARITNCEFEPLTQFERSWPI
jgi:hypothetical protein